MFKNIFSLLVMAAITIAAIAGVSYYMAPRDFLSNIALLEPQNGPTAYAVFEIDTAALQRAKLDEISEDMQMLHEDNLKSLLYLLTEEDIDELLTIIEINRELGRFEKCLALLQRINSDKHEWLRVKFSNEILKKNKKVFRLN